MTKIKSTIDIIMEKTKNLSLNEEEKKALKRKDLEERVRVFTLRFIKEERGEESLVNELQKIPEEEKTEAKKICFDILLEEFSPFDENPRILHGIQEIMGAIRDEVLHQIMDGLRQEFKRREEELRKEAASRLYKELESEDLRGSAIIPHIEATAFWKIELEKLIHCSQEALYKKLENIL